METGKKITQQEASVKSGQKSILVNEILKNLIEQIAIQARKSEFVDAKSGVSARMTISAYENLLSSVELRALKNNEKDATARISDVYGAISAINGKIELVYEGELEGPVFVAQNLIGKAIREEFGLYFPNPEKEKKKKIGINHYKRIIDWFANSNTIDLLHTEKQKDYKSKLLAVDGLQDLILNVFPKAKESEKLFLMEFALHGIAEYSLVSKQQLDEGLKFKDLLDSMLLDNSFDYNEDDNLN